MFTLATLPQTIAWVERMDADYAAYMRRMYARFLPGGEFA